MVAHADGHLVPDDRLPELEARCLPERLGVKHGFLVTQQIEMAVGLAHPVHLGEQLGKAGIREYAEPVIAGCLAMG
ncbi:hypothetical protein D3C85_1805310 [compost metagenome]